VINDFLERSEMDAILYGLDATPESELIKINDGFISYPISFAQFTQGIMNNTLSEDTYYRNAQKFRHEFSESFGVDMEQKVLLLFDRIFANQKIRVPSDRKSLGSFMPFNFRRLKPEFGELKLHCENLFFNEFPLFFELLSHAVRRKNDFSFFIVLQKPDSGGELCLYDAKWNEEDGSTVEIP
jgi:hypothetical protein